MTSLGAIVYSFTVVFIIFLRFVMFCDEEKKLLYLICHFFLHICTYLTFDLTVTLNQKITPGIDPYIVCNSLKNNSSLDAKH